MDPSTICEVSWNCHMMVPGEVEAGCRPFKSGYLLECQSMTFKMHCILIKGIQRMFWDLIVWKAMIPWSVVLYQIHFAILSYFIIIIFVYKFLKFSNPLIKTVLLSGIACTDYRAQLKLMIRWDGTNLSSLFSVAQPC